MDSLLGDFDNATRAGVVSVRGRGDVKGVDNTQLAALSATIEVSE
mgnify:CR=1 FL=1